MALPYDIYKVKLIKKRQDNGDSVPYYEYEVTSPHNGYNTGDRLMLDNDLKTIIQIKRYQSPQKSPIQKYTRNTQSQSTHVTSQRTSQKPAVQQKNTSTTKTQKVSNTTSTKSKQKTRNRIKSKSNFVSSKTPSNKIIPKNDLSFISQYIQAYQNGDQKRLNAFNIALAKNPNKNLIWHGIWRGIDPSHTQELSDSQHEMLYTIHPGTKNEMGQMNWYNIFDGNLLHATAPNSLDFVSPEWRAKTIQLTTNPQYVAQTPSVETSDNIDDIIRSNADLFRSQYEYAKQHNGAFDYTPSSFDTSNLNINYKYGGIGDFMDAYGLNPQGLYKRLDNIYNQKYQTGGRVNKPKEKTDGVKSTVNSTQKNIDVKKKDTPQQRQQVQDQAYLQNMLKFTTDYLGQEASHLYGRPYKGYYYHGFDNGSSPTPTNLQKIKNDKTNLYRYFFGL